MAGWDSLIAPQANDRHRDVARVLADDTMTYHENEFHFEDVSTHDVSLVNTNNASYALLHLFKCIPTL